jgi:hypothetical protein
MSTKGNDYSYYSSKSDLLTWVNNLLQLQLTRIEQVWPSYTCIASPAVLHAWPCVSY